MFKKHTVLLLALIFVVASAATSFAEFGDPWAPYDPTPLVNGEQKYCPVDMTVDSKDCEVCIDKDTTWTCGLIQIRDCKVPTQEDPTSTKALLFDSEPYLVPTPGHPMNYLGYCADTRNYEGLIFDVCCCFEDCTTNVMMEDTEFKFEVSIVSDCTGEEKDNVFFANVNVSADAGPVVLVRQMLTRSALCQQGPAAAVAQQTLAVDFYNKSWANGTPSTAAPFTDYDNAYTYDCFSNETYAKSLVTQGFTPWPSGAFAKNPEVFLLDIPSMVYDSSVVAGEDVVVRVRLLKKIDADCVDCYELYCERYYCIGTFTDECTPGVEPGCQVCFPYVTGETVLGLSNMSADAADIHITFYYAGMEVIETVNVAGGSTISATVGNLVPGLVGSAGYARAWSLSSFDAFTLVDVNGAGYGYLPRAGSCACPTCD